MRKVLKYCVTLAMLLVTVISMTHSTYAYSNRIFFSRLWDTSWDILLHAKSSAQPYKYSGNELSKKFFDNHRLRQRMSRDAGKESRRSWIAVGISQADRGNYDTNNGLNLYDFHARQHDPYASHFTTIDPLAEVNPGISPYVFCAGNPINYIDPSGLKWISATYEGEKFYFFDDRINEASDIASIYGKDNQLTFIGDSFEDINNKVSLYEDGTYSFNGEIQNKVVDIEGKLHIGTIDQVEKNTIMKNLYGNYLGSNNPKSKNKENKTDYYAVPPKDELDYAAFLHDRDYDSAGAAGPLHAVLNTKVKNNDLTFLFRANRSLLNSKLTSEKFFISLLTSCAFRNIFELKLILSASKVDIPINILLELSKK